MNIGELIDHYQEWVDYDMKRYGKISDETNRDIREAGLQVVKDEYGDYEVIAGKYNESLKESLNSDIVSMIKKQFPKATVKTSIRKHSDVHKSNPNTARGKTKYVDIRITPDETSSVNSILQYCNHNIKKVLDRDNRFYYYGDVPARNPRGSKEVILSYEDYSDLSDDEYKSLISEPLKESLKGENGWIKRWNSLDKYYKGDLVISKINSPYEAWHIEKVAPNGRTIKHLGNYKSLKVAMDAAEQYLIKNESKSIEHNVVPDESLEASKSRTFIELPEFQKLWQKFNLTDDDLMSLQNQIINGNQAVSLGSNVYKIRFSPKQISKGKDTTDRVIYIDYIIDSKVYLVTIFSKSDESNLTKDELNNIRKLSKSLEVK